MKYSIAIPAYKPQYLQEAIASVLAQTYPNWELVLVDDCSPFDLQAITAPFQADSRVRYYRNASNFGAEHVVDNWNRCLDLCTGDYVICMGDDDRLLPECLSTLDALISQAPEYGVYHLRTQLIDGEGRVTELLESRPRTETSLEMLLHRWEGRGQFIGDFCFNRLQLKTIGGFYNLPMAWGTDDITAYLAAKGGGALKDGIGNVDVPVFQYRVHAQTLSSSATYKLKMQALNASAHWFHAELCARALSAGSELPLVEKLQSMEAGRHAHFAKEYVWEDVRVSPKNILYWLRHRKDCRLSLYAILVQSLKGLLQ